MFAAPEPITPDETSNSAGADLAAELAARVQLAGGAGTPLRLRGGGTKDFYGQSLEGEVLDLSGHHGIVSYEPSELVVTARAGTPLAGLEALLAGQGQCLPFEPPHFGRGATVGGMVASGLSGPARAASGAVRDFVLGAVILNGRAEVLHFGGQVMKNVAGYDVSRLMAGSMGTLAVLLEVSLKVLPVPPAESTLVFELDEAAALRQLNRWGGQPLPVNASCWQDGRLWVRLRGAVAAVKAAEAGMGGQRLGEASGVFWAALREQTLPFFGDRPAQPGSTDRAGQSDQPGQPGQPAQPGQPDQPAPSLWRLSVPDTAAPLGLGATLIEWGGAQRWVHRPAADAALVREAAARAGGHATLFRSGDKTVPVFTAPKPPLDRIHRELKREFDPAGLFNPHRMAGDW